MLHTEVNSKPKRWGEVSGIREDFVFPWPVNQWSAFSSPAALLIWGPWGISHVSLTEGVEMLTASHLGAALMGLGQERSLKSDFLHGL